MDHLLSRGKTVFSFYFLLLFCFQGAVCAQTVTKQKTVTKTTNIVVAGTKEVTLDISGRSFSDILPFDVPFILSGTTGISDKMTIDKIIAIECFYQINTTRKDDQTIPNATEETKYKNGEDGRMYASWQNNGADTKWRLSIKELMPNRHYSFFFKFKRKLSDDERAKLAEHASRIIPPLIAKHVDNNIVSLSIAEIGQIVSETVDKLKSDLAKNGQDITATNLSSVDQNIIAKAMGDLSFAFQQRIDEQQSISWNIDALKADSAELEKVLSRYKASADKKPEHVNAINNALLLLKSVFTYPKGDNAVNKGQSYLDNIERVKAELEKANIPGDEYGKVKTALTDHLEDITTNFNGYAERINNLSKVTDAEMDKFVATVIRTYEDAILVSATTTNNNFVTRSNSFITADIGVALLPSIGKMVPYLGTNIYLRPINQDRPLFIKDLFTGKDFDRRFSLMLGLTYSTLAKDGYRENLMSTFNLITGAGLRIADFVKVNGGVVWYTKLNTNPLNTNNTVRGLGFVSLSFDLQIKTVFHKLFTADVTTIPTKP